MLFKYREPVWYGFGLRLGLRNLFRNRFKIGYKKSLGKILQPINAFTRFPEYHFFEEDIKQCLSQRSRINLKVLDVGSPKLFGLFLANTYNLQATLTDISWDQITEFPILWELLENRSRGSVRFEIQDGRFLPYPNDCFDIVYSMSVLEHIEGEGADEKAVTEMWRVLKPGGRLLVSMPIGDDNVEQTTTGFSYLPMKDKTEKPHFFQRIYDCASIEEKIIKPIKPMCNLRLWTCYRVDSSATVLFHRIQSLAGNNLNGLLGFLNPIYSLIFNRHAAGMCTPPLATYAKVRSLRDVYGDLVITCTKPLVGLQP